LVTPATLATSLKTSETHEPDGVFLAMEGRRPHREEKEGCSYSHCPNWVLMSMNRERGGRGRQARGRQKEGGEERKGEKREREMEGEGGKRQQGRDGGKEGWRSLEEGEEAKVWHSHKEHRSEEGRASSLTKA
jgi:hypothetical protein